MLLSTNMIYVPVISLRGPRGPLNLFFKKKNKLRAFYASTTIFFFHVDATRSFPHPGTRSSFVSPPSTSWLGSLSWKSSRIDWLFTQRTFLHDYHLMKFYQLIAGMIGCSNLPIIIALHPPTAQPNGNIVMTAHPSQ